MPRRLRLSALLGVLCFSVQGAAAPPAPALDFFVDSTADFVDLNPGDGICGTRAGCTLRAAVMEANASPGSDTVVLASGTYTLAIPGANEDAAETGDLDVTDPIVFSGPFRLPASIDAAGLDRVLHVHGVSVSLSRVDLTGGSGQTLGGGVLVENGSLSLQSVTIRGNSAGVGGGVHFQSGDTLMLVSSHIRENVAEGGGGIASTASNALISLSSSTVDENLATVVGGAGICDMGVGGELRLVDSSLSANDAAGNGGAIYTEASTVTITGTRLLDNHAAGRGGALYNGPGSDLTMSEVTLRGNDADDQGGALYNEAALVLERGTLDDNFAGGRGGAITNKALATLRDSTLTGNVAQVLGGAVYTSDVDDLGAVMTIERSSFTANRVLSTAAGEGVGGAIFNSGFGFLYSSDSIYTLNEARSGGAVYSGTFGTLVMTRDEIFSNESSQSAGGVDLSSTDATFIDTTIRDNLAGQDGGGVRAVGDAFFFGSTISGNVAANFGGGIHVAIRTVVFNTTISGNTAFEGGGIFAANEETILSNATIVDNVATDAPAAAGLQLSQGDVTMRNTLLDNPAGNDCQEAAGRVTSQGGNLDGDGSCPLGESDDQSDVDPLLGPLADNGGPTWTHALLAGSPAIDAIAPDDCRIAGGEAPVSEDQRGMPRPTGTGCDVGAYEVPEPRAEALAVAAVAAVALARRSRSRTQSHEDGTNEP